MEKIDWIVGCHASYLYANPKVRLISSDKSGTLAVLNDPVPVVTLNLSIQLVLKKVAFENLKVWMKHMPLWNFGM